MKNFLGEGQYGCVMKLDENYVFKYGLSFDINLEFENIKSLPLTNNFYINPEEVEIIDIDLEEQIEIMDYCSILKKEFGDELKYRVILKKIKMPFVEGIPLDTYLEFFRRKFISKKIWKNIIKSFIILFLDIFDFNSQGYYHNDIHLGNIIYDPKIIEIENFKDLRKNQYKNMKIIDFGNLSKMESMDDKIDMLYVLKWMIIFGKNNSNKIKNFLLKNKIIDENDIFIIDESELYNDYFFDILKDL